MTAAEQRDLRTGAVVWGAYPSHADKPSVLRSSCKADVVVVGAGVTGAFVAEATTAAGLTTIVIDRRLPAQGSTSGSTALIQFEIDTPLIHLADEIGFANASRAWLRSFDAVQGLARRVAQLSIACDLRARRAVYLSGDVLTEAQLAREAETRASIGLPSRFLGTATLFQSTGIAHPAAILSTGSADLNPVQLTHALLHVAASRGAIIGAPVELADVVPMRAAVELATTDGLEIEAKSVVFATGYELVHGVPSKGHKRSSTWAFATQPQPEALGALSDAVIWEASDPYLYIRSTMDGRLIVGGEDQDIDDAAKRDALIDDKVIALREKVQHLLPGLSVKSEYAWAGTFGESDTGLPTIGPVPKMPNCYAALGYGGNGITFGYLAAQLVQAYLSGRTDPDFDLFAFKP